MSIILDALKKTQEKMASPLVGESLAEAKLHANEEFEQRQHQNDKLKSDNEHQTDFSAPRRKPVKHSRNASFEATGSFPWKIAGLTSLIGLAIVVFVGGASVFDFHFERNPSMSAIQKPQPAAAQLFLSAPPYLVLNGTMVEGKHRIAVINDKTYTIGDQIDNKKITAILMDKVMLQDGKTTLELKARA